MTSMESKESDVTTLVKLQSACSSLRSLVETSTNLETSLLKTNSRFDVLQDTLTNTCRAIAPLQSLAMATKALDTRINRAVSPALSLLESFRHAEALQEKLLNISNKLINQKNPSKRLKYLVKYVDCVDQLNDAIDSISQDCEPAIQKLQEVVEFLSRTKATDPYRTRRLKDTLVTLKALYETEVDAMRYEGLLDEALLNLQDEYESLLQQLKHKNICGGGAAAAAAEHPPPHDADAEVQQVDTLLLEFDDIQQEIPSLGSELEIDVLRRMAETLSRNDCLDICIDIFVKVRYTRAAKALMRLNPDYLRTYTPEEIDEMEWESLETAITLWIQHFELAVRTVFVSEKKLCNQVLSQVMDGIIWAECFVKIADKIMAVFFRFGEGVTRSSKEPQKLFKLLDMFDSLGKLKPDFSDIFQGEAGADICLRFRELEKLLVHASSKVFWEFGLQIEGNQDGLPPPQDGSVPKLVRYAINYLKYLATNNYSGSMAKVLRTEQIWKAGILSKPPESDENLLKDAILNVMEALERNIDSKKVRYKDKVLVQIFSMNTYWYIYMRSRNSEMSKLLGEQLLKKRYKTVAEESAYMYQRQAWRPIVRLLLLEEERNEAAAAAAPAASNRGELIRGKMEAFMKGFNDNIQRHRSSYNIPDADLREQIREATVKLVVPAYASFLTRASNSSNTSLQVKSFLPPHSIEELLGQTFGFDATTNQNQNLITTTASSGSSKFTTSRRRNFKDQSAAGEIDSASAERFSSNVKGFRRMNSSGDKL